MADRIYLGPACLSLASYPIIKSLISSVITTSAITNPASHVYPQQQQQQQQPRHHNHIHNDKINPVYPRRYTKKEHPVF